MKKFQQLLSQQSQNEYGLQYRAIKPTKNLFRNIQNSYESRSIENPQTVDIYLKSDHNKSLKMKLTKRNKIEKLKQTIEEKLSIPFQDQIIYLNGKEISVFSSITLNQKQIIHITDRKNIVGLHQNIRVTLRVYAPNESPFNGKIYGFSLTGGDKIFVLKSLLLSHDDFIRFEEIFQFNFLESGRMLGKEESFTENLITKNCDITCLLSKNQIETKFSNQCQQIDQEDTVVYKRIETSPKKIAIPNGEAKDSHINFGGLKFNKLRVTSNKFLINKGKSSIYTKISKTTNESQIEHLRRNQHKHKSDSDASLQGSGFKKKKPYQEECQNDDSHLMKKIIVHKSRQEIERIASQSSLIKESVNELEQENKSVVSSSSSDENGKKYIPIRQQKQYRPSPLIPQRKMAPSQKIKINMELQKLFGGNQENKTNDVVTNESEDNEEQSPEPQVETTRSRVIIRNLNMRNSIGSKESILRTIKDRKPSNRYGQQNLQKGD